MARLSRPEKEQAPLNHETAASKAPREDLNNTKAQQKNNFELGAVRSRDKAACGNVREFYTLPIDPSKLEYS